MPASSHKRALIISIPQRRRRAFYTALRQLHLFYPQFHTSALIVRLVLDAQAKPQALADMQRLTTAQAGEDPSPLVSMDAIDEDEDRGVVGVSLPQEIRSDFYQALHALRERDSASSTSALIVNLVIEAGSRLAITTTDTEQDDPPDDDGRLQSFPDLYREKFYTGQLDALVSVVPEVQKTLKSFSGNAYPPDILSLNYQLVGIVLCDTGSFDEAFRMMGKALAYAEALSEAHPDRANLIASAYYRQGTLFLQLMETTLTPYEQEAFLDKAKQNSDRAMSLVPACDPIVRAVVLMRDAILLARTDAQEQKILVQLSDIQQLVTPDVLEYHPVGFVFGQASVDHAYAQIVYYLHTAGRLPQSKELSLEEALRRLEEPAHTKQPIPQRWKVDSAITRVRLLIASDKLHAALEEAKQVYPYLTQVQSQRLRQSLDQALNTMPRVESESYALRKKIATLG
jgi:tetratricopeptide (TPR) repeat protein